jgi:hypothetical protein
MNRKNNPGTESKAELVMPENKQIFQLRLHNYFSRLSMLLAQVLLLLSFAGGQSISANERKILDGFTKQVKSYVDKEHALPAQKLKPSADVDRLESERLELRRAVQQSRPDARQGDFFSPEVSHLFRKLLAKTLDGPDGAQIKASLNHAEPSASPLFRVNGEFPNRQGQPIQSLPPTLLKNLPVLPKGVDYSIAQNTLALRDTNANLVIDFLPNAFR